jgi:hypothetical protein
VNYDKARRLYQHALEYASQNRPSELAWGRSVTPDTLENMTADQFLTEYCWVVYASGFRVSVIEKKFDQLKAAFQDFDIEKLAEMQSVEPVLTIFNNVRKANGFLRGAKQIHREGFSNFKKRLQQDGMKVLRGLPYIGEVTQKHLAKNIGLQDVPKDDVWLVRLTEKCDAASVEELTSYLAREFDETQHTVDLVLWRFCADGGWRQFGFSGLDEFLER